MWLSLFGAFRRRQRYMGGFNILILTQSGDEFMGLSALSIFSCNRGIKTGSWYYLSDIIISSVYHFTLYKGFYIHLLSSSWYIYSSVRAGTVSPFTSVNWTSQRFLCWRPHGSQGWRWKCSASGCLGAWWSYLNRTDDKESLRADSGSWLNVYIIWKKWTY